jgi:asparagine synthase (glutamine-hydrolysing)
MSVEIFFTGGLYLPDQESRSQGDFRLTLGKIYNPGDDRYSVSLAKVANNPELLNDLESDLSMAYFFAEKNSLRLIRDACGANPLFYARRPDGGWAYAFSLDMLFRILGFTPPLDEATFYDFTATHYRHVFRDPGRTFHQGVRQVPAGFYVDISGDAPVERRWLNLAFDPQVAAMSPQEASERYVSLLDQSVKIRLDGLKEEEIGFTISSGMDSPSVAALAARALGKPLDVWYVAYKDQAQSPYDESAGVKALVKATGWNLHQVNLAAPDLLEEAKSLMQLVKAPMVTVTWLAHFVMAKKAKEAGFDFLFSGLGGDESLAGEFEHFFVFFADLMASGQTELLAKETEAWIRLHDHPEFKKSIKVRDDWIKRNCDLSTGEIFVDQARYTAVRPWFNPEWVEAREALAPPVPMPRPFPYFLSNRLFQEMSYETSPPTLWSEALSSLAANIQGVFPMTSLRCLAAALSAPGTSKYENGVTKMLLRRAMTGILPDSTRLNPVKTGFNAPLDLWLRDKKLSGDCRDLLKSSKFLSLGWISSDSIDKIFYEHLSGQSNHMMLLWPLISTALFLEIS